MPAQIDLKAVSVRFIIFPIVDLKGLVFVMAKGEAQCINGLMLLEVSLFCASQNGEDTDLSFPR